MTRAQPLNVAVFTPGPWESTATVAMHDRPDLPCVVDQFRLVVAQCWDDGHSEDECEANARLIAAAPDMHRALTDLLELVRAHGLEPCNDIPMHEFEAIVDGACQDASRALGKVSA